MKKKKRLADETDYAITRLSACGYRVQKYGSTLPGYLVKLPAECDCPSRKKPCKHVAMATVFHFEEIRHARIEAARRKYEDALIRVGSDSSEAARLQVEAAHYSLRMVIRFKS